MGLSPLLGDIITIHPGADHNRVLKVVYEITNHRRSCLRTQISVKYCHLDRSPDEFTRRNEAEKSVIMRIISGKQISPFRNIPLARNITPVEMTIILSSETASLPPPTIKKSPLLFKERVRVRFFPIPPNQNTSNRL